MITGSNDHLRPEPMISFTGMRSYDCLILDDLGYTRKDQAETTVLFELIAERSDVRCQGLGHRFGFARTERSAEEVGRAWAGTEPEGRR
jgi:hypothetical protein